LIKRFLNAAGVKGVAIGEFMSIVFFDADRWEDILPNPISLGLGVFFGKGEGEWNLSVSTF